MLGAQHFQKNYRQHKINVDGDNVVNSHNQRSRSQGRVDIDFFKKQRDQDAHCGSQGDGQQHGTKNREADERAAVPEVAEAAANQGAGKSDGCPNG